MKISIFYSWQSDLPNNKNRGLIENSLNKAKEIILIENKGVTEIEIISDSRGDKGTPDLVSSIFNKIDNCDIFIADISIINPKSDRRPTPNPNVLIELGYASHALGWNKLICLFNAEYAKPEILPFDIRTRKPVISDTTLLNTEVKQSLTRSIVRSVNDIVNSILFDKNEYIISKRTIDLAMQAILIDFCKLLYDDQEKYNYNKLLMSSIEDVEQYITNKRFLGFLLYMNITKDIKEFTDYFNDNLEMYFLSDKEKRILAKLVFSLKSYERLLNNGSVLKLVDEEKQLMIIDAYKANPTNPRGSYILAKPNGSKQAIVISGGDFTEPYASNLLNIYQLTDGSSTVFASAILHIVDIVNEWISCSGKYFIVNIRGIPE